jgi:hypothetical protein
MHVEISSHQSSLARANQRPSPMADLSNSETGLPETRFTIFSIPKPFHGAADQIQRNAIGSWKQLGAQVDVLLLGNDKGISEAAAELGVGHASDVARNQFGTPRLDSAFAIAQEVAKTPLMVYCNCDVIFLDDFAAAMKRLHQSGPEAFVAFGRRKDVLIEESIDFRDADQVAKLERLVQATGRLDSIVCKEYFVFLRGKFQPLPPFAVGRGNWDNWMIRSSKWKSIPVIDLSNLTTAIHQQHDYSHIGRNRWKCYVSGPEARENQRLAGGRHLISGSTPTWKLTEAGLRPVSLASLNWEFWKESHRFLRLMKNLVFGSC